MPQVTLRNLSTNEDILVPASGYIFGRLGGNADIQLEDSSISRRQTRVSLRGNQWLAETLAIPQGARPPRPVLLHPGATFSIGRSQFEVVQIDGESEPGVDPEATVGQGKTLSGAPVPSPPPARKAPAPSAPTPLPPSETQEHVSLPEPSSGGMGALFSAVPKGIAYYLLNVPKMLFNPFGAVRTAMENLPPTPMGRSEIIGHALPALLATALLGSIASGLAKLIAGGGFELLLFVPIIPAAVSVITAVITGFIFHPVLTWIIKLLKGESDGRSRSQYLLQSLTLSVVLAVPGALGSILSALPVPFLGLLGLVLSVLSTLISLYVTFRWFTFFGVVKWFRMLIVGLGCLAVLSAAWGLVQGVRASIQGMSGGGESGKALSGPTTPPEGEEPGGGPSAGLAAAEDLGEGGEDPLRADSEGQAQALKPKPDRKAEQKAEQEAAQKAEKKSEQKTESEVEQKSEQKSEQKAEPEPVVAKEAAPIAKKEEPPPLPSSKYATFARKREAIEKRFGFDPTVLQRSAELQRLYADYVETAYELDKKWSKATAKKPERAKLHALLCEAELFGRTGKTIDALAAKLNIR